jgi:hypothetical protein
MYNNAMPHHSRAITAYLQSEDIKLAVGNHKTTDECCAKEVPEPVHDGLTCPKYPLWDSNPDSCQGKEQK